jgi:hypothetical protein
MHEYSQTCAADKCRSNDVSFIVSLCNFLANPPIFSPLKSRSIRAIALHFLRVTNVLNGTQECTAIRGREIQVKFRSSYGYIFIEKKSCINKAHAQ